MNNCNSDHERQRAKLALLVTRVLLSAGAVLAQAAPVAAHGDDDAHAAGPAADWLVVLVYLELAAVPLIGFLLLRQARDAWRPAGPRTNGDRT